MTKSKMLFILKFSMSFKLPGLNSCNKQSKSSVKSDKSFNSFDVNLFNKLCESSDDSENIFFSPMSISLALSVLLVGSNERTKQQLEEALGVENDKQLLSNLKALNDVLNSNSDGLQIKLANSVFPSKTFEMVAKYKSDLESAFKCQMQTLDYMSNAEKSKTIINDWVASCTNGKIKNLFMGMDPDTACVLVSCIYSKGDWLNKFNPRYTSDAPFHCAEKKTSTVKMMTSERRYLYANVDEKGFKCVKILYKDRNFSMMIILPNKRFGVEDVIKKLDAKTIENLKEGKQFWNQLIILKMPKFRIEYEAILNKTLRSLEIKDAFDRENADFSAMSLQSKGLYVDEVVHKAFVETSEEGTEAAAATGIRTCKYSFSFDPKPLRFTVDHPFVFMILHKDQTLFMGKVTSL